MERDFIRSVGLFAAVLAPLTCCAAAPLAGAGDPRTPAGRAASRLLSKIARVVSTPPGAQVATDGIPENGGWQAGMPTKAKPSTVAMDVGKGPTRVLVWWQSSGNSNYEETTYGGPGSYRIETSPDSTDGKNGSWTVAASVVENKVMNRAHAIDFAGQRWVRLAITGPSPTTYQYGVQLDTVAVHDLSRGNEDTWLFVGDSITAEVFRGGKFQPSFSARVHQLAPGYEPATLVAGVGYTKSGDLLAKLPTWLDLNKDLTVWAIGIGTNNPYSNVNEIASYRSELEAIVKALLDAGKVPIVARIPWRADSDIAPLNLVVDDVVKKYGLHPGPDLYAWFKAHPDQLRDGLHPTPEGARQIHRLWAEAVADLYPALVRRPPRISK